MSIATPPPAPPKKKGLGCLGCGCLIVLAIAALILGLICVGSYSTYHRALALTSPTPTSVTVAPVTDDFYQSVKQKLSDFNHDVKNHQPATIQLSGDEINAIIARDPYLSAHHVQMAVTIEGDQASIQASIPTDVMIQALFTGRYVNFSTTFGADFNSDSKMLNVTLHSLQVGDQSIPANSLPMLQAELTPILNVELQKNPDIKQLLDQTKSIQIENGNLVIETQ